jgi:hypothetical protein
MSSVLKPNEQDDGLEAASIRRLPFATAIRARLFAR